ncbi:MAG TPA: amidohydrolase family protein [Candidatus Limnocylindrales bacterium]
MKQRIEADLLIPGRGDPVPDGAVEFEGGVITYAGPAGSPEPEALRVPVVMPGLWDCHAHFIGVRSLDLSRMPQEPIALRAARAAARDLGAALDAGVTSVREVGGQGVYLARAVAEGSALGPNIYAAGAVLSTTGGHGDLHGYPLNWMMDYGHTAVTELRLCDGPSECAKAAREQLRRDAKLIKVCASGGVLSEVDHPIHQQFTLAELRAIVEVAGMAERVVAAHCHGKPGILAALEAGCKTIEHGTYLDEECAAAMREKGAILVPTRTIIAEILESKAAPPYAQAKLEALADQHTSAVELAHRSGVTIAMGTDISLTGPLTPASWGRNGREPALMAECGLSPLAAIEAATATGPETLGPQAPRSGQLKQGYDADLLVLDANPLEDLGVLADPSRITQVWLSGRRVKG